MSLVSRRMHGLPALSILATAGLLAALVGFSGAPHAHAAATCTVTTNADSGPGSLRQCLLDNTAGTIDFASGANGTIFLQSDLPTVALTAPLTITGNGVSDTVIDGGGAHAAFHFTGAHLVTISGLTIANSDGGAVTAIDGDVTVTQSSFSNNYKSFGAAVDARTGDVTISRSSFSDNSVFANGGAVRAISGIIDIDASTFSNNSAAEGGAVATFEGSITATNSTFVSNSATTNGGAIWGEKQDASTTVVLDFVTVVGNTSPPNATGAVHSRGTATITNSIVYGNAGGLEPSGGDVFTNDGPFLASYSLFTAESSIGRIPPSPPATALIFGQDPLLAPLADNGGPTRTMLPRAGSPVIGAANAAGAPATDQRGLPRTTDGLASMGSAQGIAEESVLPDLSQVPPSWHQAQGREQREASCPPGMAPSWAQWPNEGTGGWTCEYTTWWDVNEGVGGGWVTTPGFRVGRFPAS